MKATERYFPVVLFVMLYKVVLTAEFLDESRKCDHSTGKASEQYFPGMVFYIMLYNIVVTLTLRRNFIFSQVLVRGGGGGGGVSGGLPLRSK